MKLKVLAAGLALAVLAGCGTSPYVPTEYPLRAGLIPPRPVSGDVTINNAQADTAQALVYEYGGSNLASDYKTITQALVNQATKELATAGQKAPGKAKTIDVKVTYMKSTYIAFYWKSELKYTATLGNAATIDKTVNHGSGVLIQDLNGLIAESAMNLLNDPKVLAYLAE